MSMHENNIIMQTTRKCVVTPTYSQNKHEEFFVGIIMTIVMAMANNINHSSLCLMRQTRQVSHVWPNKTSEPCMAKQDK